MLGWLVLPQAFIHDVPKQIVVGPGEKLYLGDELRPHPMHPAEPKRGSEAGIRSGCRAAAVRRAASCRLQVAAAGATAAAAPRC